jgi:hypothetical protein
MSIQSLQRAAAAGWHRPLPAVLGQSALAFVPPCDVVVIQTA